MPDSPKIWGTLELEKQGDWLRRHRQAVAHCSPVPGGEKLVGALGRRPLEPCEQPPAGNRPVNTSC